VSQSKSRASHKRAITRVPALIAIRTIAARDGSRSALALCEKAPELAA